MTIPDRQTFLRLKLELPFEGYIRFKLDARSYAFVYDDAWAILALNPSLRAKYPLLDGNRLIIPAGVLCKSAKPCLGKVYDQMFYSNRTHQWELESRLFHDFNGRTGVPEFRECALGTWEVGNWVKFIYPGKARDRLGVIKFVHPQGISVMMADKQFVTDEFFDMRDNTTVVKFLNPEAAAAELGMDRNAKLEVPALKEAELKALLDANEQDTYTCNRIKVLDKAALLVNDPSQPPWVRYWHAWQYHDSDLGELAKKAEILGQNGIRAEFKQWFGCVPPVDLATLLLNETRCVFQGYKMTLSESRECLNKIFNKDALNDEEDIVLDPYAFIRRKLNEHHRNEMVFFASDICGANDHDWGDHEMGDLQLEALKDPLGLKRLLPPEMDDIDWVEALYDDSRHISLKERLEAQTKIAIAWLVRSGIFVDTDSLKTMKTTPPRKTPPDRLKMDSNAGFRSSVSARR